MFTSAQHSRLSPVVAAAWFAHCKRLGLEPRRKAPNGYRAWYEDILEDATDKRSTSDLTGARSFGKVMLAFAQVAGNVQLVRDLAADEEHRYRWVLRMIAVDLSYLRGDEIGWEYIRSIYGQSKLPPGDFDDCPAELLDRVIPMLDTQIRRECERLGIRKCELPRRAKDNPGRHGQHRDAMEKKLAALAQSRGMSPESLRSWHNQLISGAWTDINSARHNATITNIVLTADSSTSDCPF